MALAITLHTLAALIWVGGMFFAHVALRPAAATLLEPPQRLPLWQGVFTRFFPWVWAAVILLLVTGYWIVFAVFGGMARAGVYVHVMNGTGLVMAVIFAVLFFGPYSRFRAAVSEQRWPEAAKHLTWIRRLVGTNLTLGLATAAIAVGGRYLT